MIESTSSTARHPLRMPGTVVALLVAHLLIIVGWSVNASVPLILAWSGFGVNGILFSHDASYSILVTVLCIPAVVGGLVGIVTIVGLYRGILPGGGALLLQVLAVLFMTVVGLVFPLSGTVLALLLAPLLILNAVLLRRESSVRWLSVINPVNPSQRVLAVVVATALFVPFWMLFAIWLSLRLVTLALLQAAGADSGPTMPFALPATVALPLGAVANVIVLLAIARRWRMPRGGVLAGSVLAATALVVLVPMMWWAAMLAVVPPVLLWVPAFAQEFSNPALGTTSEIAPRHPG